MERGSRLILVGALALLAVPAISFADLSSDTFYLTVSNELASGPVYGTVQINADTAAGTVHFLVTPETDVYDAIGPNFGIQKFGFNFAGASVFTDNLASIGWTMNTNTAMSTFGKFELVPTGDGSTRQQPLDFTLTLADKSQATVGNFASQLTTQGYMFSAHIADFALGGISGLSHFVANGSPVPAPGAALLCVLGLGSVAADRRRFAS